jgi:eukaryotic-like serine/threonine-protein kinase
VLKEDVAEFPENVPASVRQVALHCLEKKPANRFQSAQDLAFAIVALGAGSVSVTAPALTASAPASRRRWVAVPAAFALLLAGVLGGLRFAGSPPPDVGQQRHRLLVSETNAFPLPRWSPDGKSITYGTFAGIFVQSLDSAIPNLVVKMVDAPAPFFSADGLRVWYTSWQDGRSVWSVSATGGEPQKVLGNLGGFVVMDGGALSPDGKSLVVAAASGETLTLAVSSPPGTAPRPLAGAPVFPTMSVVRARIRFSHDGSKLLAVFLLDRENTELWTMPWPPGKGEARRVPVVLREHEVAANADWMTDNRHIVIATAPAGAHVVSGRLVLADSQSGAAWALTADNAGAADASVSHDGRIVFSRTREIYDLMEFPVDGSAATELLATDWVESFGSWSRTADEYVYVGERGGESAIWVASADGSWQRRVTTSGDFGGAANFAWPEFSPDSKRIAYRAQGRIWISPAGGGRSTPVTPVGAVATPTWSSDGRWIAYADPTGVWKVEAGGSAAPVRVFDSGGIVPAAWSPDGKWITAGVEGKIGVVSPDGTQKRVCFDRPFHTFEASLGWSHDGATLFLMERIQDHSRLSAFDLARGAERVIRDYPPDTKNNADPYTAGSRLYPSRDGKRLLGSRWEPRASVWVLDGVTLPRPWWRFWR